MKKQEEKDFCIVTVKLTLEERKKLDAICSKLKRSMAAQVKFWIEQEFDKLSGN